MPPRSAKSKNASFVDDLLSPKGIVIILIILVLLSIGAYVISTRKPIVNNHNATIVTPTPSPTPTRLYPDNGVKGTYNVSANQTNGPRIKQVVFDPLNAQKGQRLTLTVDVNNNTPVQQITGEFKMDNESQHLTFTLTGKTNTDEVWQATISALPDSVLYNYSLDVIAVAANGKGFGGAAPRSR